MEERSWEQRQEYGDKTETKKTKISVMFDVEWMYGVYKRQI